MGLLPAARARVGARSRRSRLGVVVARRRRRAARVLDQRRHVRRWAASRHRHRPRCLVCDTSAGFRRGHICRTGADERTHRDDRDGRLQDVPHPSGSPPRPARCQCGRGRSRCRAWPVRRGGVRPPLHSPRYPGRHERELRRPTRTASASKCCRSSPGTRGAARAPFAAHSRTAGGCEPSRSGASARSRCTSRRARYCTPATNCRDGTGADRCTTNVVWRLADRRV